MKGRGTRNGFIALALVLLLTLLLGITAYAEKPERTVSGSCGANVTWTLDKRGNLTVSGTGKMDDFMDPTYAWERYKDSIRTVHIEEGVESIGGYAFAGCPAITSISLPDSVTSIGVQAFSGCVGIKSVTIPDKVISIGEGAFAGCTGLTSVNIPKNVKTIGLIAFSGCTNLTNIHVEEGNPSYASRDGVLFDKNFATLITCPMGKKGSYRIPGSVTRIEESAFASCEKLTSVTIPEGVTVIDAYTFYNCTKLASLTIPVSVTEIKSWVFAMCNSLTDVYYDGTGAQWKKIEIGGANVQLENANIHCQLDAPVIAAASYVTASGKPYVRWNAVAEATKYEVYRAVTKNGTYTCIGSTADTKYTDKTAGAGYTYYYKVKAVDANGSAGGFSAAAAIVCRCAKPVVKSSTNADGKPRLTWNAVAGASKYEVYRSTSENGTYTKMFTTTGTSYTNTSAQVGVTYYYKVRAVSSVKSKGNSALSTVAGITCRCAKPVVQISANADGKPRLTWNAVAGASKYEVYRATRENGTYAKVFTTTGRSYTHVSAKVGTTYYYKVKAVSGENSAANSAFSAVSRATCCIAQPVVQITTNADGKPRLMWNTVAGADGYEVYRSTSENGTYTKVFTTTGRSYTHVSAKADTTYYYKVKAVSGENNTANSAFSVPVSIRAR